MSEMTLTPEQLRRLEKLREASERGLSRPGPLTHEGFHARSKYTSALIEHERALLDAARRALEHEAKEAGLWGRVNTLADRVLAEPQNVAALEQQVPTGEVVLSPRDRQLCRDWVDQQLGEMLGERDEGEERLVGALKALYAALGRESAQGGWIAVEERLPEPPRGGVAAHDYVARFVAYYDNGEWWRHGPLGLRRCEVRGWWPLPEIPPAPGAEKGGAK